MKDIFDLVCQVYSRSVEHEIDDFCCNFDNILPSWYESKFEKIKWKISKTGYL